MASIILFNKPFRVLCQFTDKEGRSTLSDYIDQKNVYPAGRLDYDSEGLMILTNDGKLQYQISNPKAKMSKTYWVQIEGEPTITDLLPFAKGIQLKDGLCRPAKAKIIKAPKIWDRQPPIRTRHNKPTSWLEIVISEGRNRQVRRMTSAIGFPTLRLIRSQIGPWHISDLNPGEYKELTVHSSNNNFKKQSPKSHTQKRPRQL